MAKKKETVKQILDELTPLDRIASITSKNKYRVDFRDVSSMEEQLHWKKEAYLKERGWEYTSSLPGSFWVYVKKLPKTYGDKVFVCDESTAMHIQESLDADVGLFDDCREDG